MRWQLLNTIALVFVVVTASLAQESVSTNIMDGMIYPVGYMIDVKCSECSIYLNEEELDPTKFPLPLTTPGLYTLRIVQGQYMDIRNFEVVDYVPLIGTGTIATLEDQGDLLRIGVIAEKFQVDPRFALHYTPQIHLVCPIDVVISAVTLYSIDTLAQYHSVGVYASGNAILAYFDIPHNELGNSLFIVGTMRSDNAKLIFDTELLSLDLAGHDMSRYTYCPGDGDCQQSCTWRSKLIRHDKNKLHCSRGTSLHGAEITGISAGNTMQAHGWAIDTLPLFAWGCFAAATGLYQKLVYHYEENPQCPCSGQQTIQATMNPSFVACATRGGASILYWMSYAKAGGYMSATVAGIGSARAEGGVHVGGDNRITIGRDTTITLTPAPLGGCAPFSDQNGGSANLSSTIVSCSSGAAIEVYAEGGMGGLATLFAKAEADIKDAACNTTLVLKCPCCGVRILTIR